MFDGECGGEEIRMYEGNGDNDGTAEEQIHNCAVACDSKKAPLSGSWDGFVATGFIIESSGRCYCESPDSATCSRHANGYDRYDWGMQGIKIHPPFDTLKISPYAILGDTALTAVPVCHDGYSGPYSDWLIPYQSVPLSESLSSLGCNPAKCENHADCNIPGPCCCFCVSQALPF